MVTTDSSILRTLPAIHQEIAEAMRQFRELVERSHKESYPSHIDMRVQELTDLWLELQKEEAMHQQ